MSYSFSFKSIFGKFANINAANIILAFMFLLIPFNSLLAQTPTITSFTPALAGNGETVVINGTDFTGATAVKFGGVAATSFVVNSATKITAVVGSAHSGTVYVETPGGVIQANDFLYKVVEYKFENNVLDATEANLDGTVLSGSVSYVTGVTGKAINLDRNPYVNLPLNLIRGLGPDFTISVMFKTTSAGIILGYSNWDVNATKPGSPEWIPILMVRSDGKLQGTLWTTANTSLKAVSTTTVNDGNWHKVDFSATATSVTIYIDGVQAGTISGAAVASLNMQFNQLGKGFADAYDYPATLTGWAGFNGALDNFIIIDKGVTATQLADNTSAASSISYPAKNILATGTPIAIYPSVVGTAITSYSVTPSLPAGLTLNTSTGIISGTPSAVTASGTYTITGTKSSGTVSTAVVISVALPANITSITGTLNPFTYCSGCTVTPQQFSVSGTSLSDDITINAPDGFEVASTINGTYASSLTIAQTAGTITTTDVFVRLSNNANQVNTGTITVETGAAATQNITLTFKADNSLNFDGTNDNVSINNTIFTNGQADFTIEAWLKPSVASFDGGYHAILGAQPNINSGNDRSPSLYITAGKIHFDSYNYNGPLNSVSSRFNFETNEVLLPQDKWSHVAMVKEGLLYTLYVNGVSKYTMAAPAQVRAIENYKLGFIDNYFGGSMDEVRFWSVAKTATEINENMTRELVGTEAGLLAYYPFNIGLPSGTNTGLTTLTDLGANSLNGTLNNFTLSGASSNFVYGFMPQITGTTSLNTGTTSALTNGLSGGTWSSANTSVVTVNPTTGLVTAIASGSALIRYTICGKLATVTITVISSTTAPSNLTYSATTITATKGTAITNITPSAGGSAVASYSISPALPAGLTLNTTTGVISGTPTALAALTTFTITATNTAGTTTSTIQLGVNDVAPSNLTYSSTNITATKGTAITSITPSSNGGAATYSISPALPAGLTLNTTTGVISGTPTALAALTTFTITATNSGGTTTSTIQLGVNDVAPSALSYPTITSAPSFGTAFTSPAPTSAGGVVASYSISPALPAGLTFDPSTGIITGTPTSIAALTTYTITATNDGGSTTTTISFGIEKAILTITASDAARCFGLTDPTITYSVTGYLNGDDASVITIAPILTTNTTSSSVAGAYKTIASGAEAANYDFIYVDGVFTVNPAPNSAITSSVDYVCDGSNLVLTTGGGSSYVWYKNGVVLTGESAASTTITGKGEYSAKVTTALGCEALAINTLAIKQYYAPVADFTSQYYCTNKPVYLTNKSTFATSGPVKYLWEDGAGYTSIANSPTFVYSNAGNKTIKLTVTPDNCPLLKQTVSKVITVETPTPAVRYNTVDAIVLNAINLTGRTIANTTSYLWSPSIYLLDARTQFPTAVLDKETSFTLQTTVASSCTTVDTVLVRVFVESDILLPSVFSPNGDGINDQLKLNLVFMSNLAYFRVYDKYNTLVFETKDKLGIWDGTFNGTPLPVDTYFWVTSGTDLNGKTINKTGAFVLSK